MSARLTEWSADVPSEVGSLVVIFQKVFKKGDQVVALAKDGTTCDEAVNDSLKKNQTIMKMMKTKSAVKNYSVFLSVAHGRRTCQLHELLFLSLH